MPYREPGVYLELDNTTPMVGNTPVMYPCIVGEGPRFIDFTKVAMNRPNDAIENPAGASSTHVTPADSNTAGTLTAETQYFYKIAYYGPGGYSLPATESTFTTGAEKTSIIFAVHDTIKTAGVFPDGVTAIKIYFSATTNQEKYVGELTDINDTLTVSALPEADADTVPVENTTTWVDVLPSSKVTSIVRIYTISNGVETEIVSTGNWTYTADNKITWTNGGPDVPVNGTVYYVDYEARPENSQYEMNFVTNFTQLKAYYDGMFMKLTTGGAKTTLNPVYLGAYLALESGAAGVKVIQVEPADKTTYILVESTDYQNTYDNYVRYDSAVYRVVPMTRNSSVVNATITHCDVYSTEEERKERVCFVGKQITAVTKSAMIAEIKAFTIAQTNKRVNFPFPDQGTKVLSDGNLYTLGQEYVCAALAGLASVLPVYRSLTKQRLRNFIQLKTSVGTNTRFTRSELNDIAGAGIMLLEQPAGNGTPIIVRHQLTTNMTRVSDREHSIVAIADYTSKLIRTSLEAYIGVYNINADTLARITQTCNLILGLLIRDHVISYGELTSIAQDQANPDTILMAVKIKPEYPCNYIDITLLLE